MRENPDVSGGSAGLKRTLARIACALNVPIHAFDPLGPAATEIGLREQVVLLDLVREKLRCADAETRQRFIEALQALQVVIEI